MAVSRLETLLNALQKFYGALPPPPRDPFTLFVWEVLSVHSTPRKRDAALAALKKIPALTPDSMWRAPQKKLEESVKLAGPYSENRIQALRTGCELFRRSPDLPKTIRGPLTGARRALKPFPQLGETGAHRMLLFAAGQAILPVDARVSRVGRRLGYGAAAGDFKKQARSVQDAHDARADDVSRRLRPRLPLSVAPRRRHLHGARPALFGVPAAEGVPGGDRNATQFSRSDPLSAAS